MRIMLCRQLWQHVDDTGSELLVQAYNRKQGNRGSSGTQVSSKGEDDEADSDSTTSASSSDLQQPGKQNGAGGNVNNDAAITDGTTGGADATSNGAFDTSAIKSKLSVKRPPGGKVRLLSLPNDSKCSRLPLAVLTCSSTCFRCQRKPSWTEQRRTERRVTPEKRQRSSQR